MLFISLLLLLPLVSSMEQSDCHLCPLPTACASVKDFSGEPLIICRCDGTKAMDSSRLPSMARFDRELAVMSSLLNVNVQFIARPIEETNTNFHNTTSDMIIDITKCYDGPTDNETMFRKAQHFIQKFMESKGNPRGPISTEATTTTSAPTSTASSSTTSSTPSSTLSSTSSSDYSVFAISLESTPSSTSSPNSSVFAISPESLYTLLIIVAVLVFLLIISIIISCVALCRRSKKNRYSVKPTECYLRDYTADESSRFLNDHF